jgi:DNA-binding GntR family transcriptional regulator
VVNLASEGDDLRPALTPAASISRREAVLAQIRRGIVVGALRPGDKLTELSLAADLYVSRATVREALGQLAQEGLVVAEPYRGLRVADLDPAALRDLARTRAALDELAARAILADGRGRRLQAVQLAWADFEATAFDDDPVVRHEGHLGFHRAVWSAAENVVLDQLWPVIQAHMTIALAQDQAVRHDPERSHRLHRDLVDALESGDAVRVGTAFREHTITSADELIALRCAHETAHDTTHATEHGPHRRTTP